MSSNNFLKNICFSVALVLGTISVSSLYAAEFSASFKGTDINEFISTVGKNLNKNFIVDPAVKGKVNVRSYDLLNEEQYYHFFLSVLEVYGYAVVPLGDNNYKVVRSAVAKTSGVKVLDDNSGIGDEMITRVVPVKNVSVRELSPLLRGLIDSQGSGNVVHYEPSNVILITGRARVVSRLVEIINRVDKAGNQEIEVVKLDHASCNEVVRVVMSLIKDDRSGAANSPLLTPKVVADERTNSVIVSGEPSARERVIKIIQKLDTEQEATGNTKVFYLRYANATSVLETLTGISKSLTGKEGQASNGSNQAKINIYANEDTNSIIVNADPSYLKEIEAIIRKLDIRRAQVLVEALIVEISDETSASLGVQWGVLTDQNEIGGLVQSGTAGPSLSYMWDSDSESANMMNVAGSISGGAIGFYKGNWFGLLNMVRADSRNDVLSTPSIITLDNEEAEFNVGQEVPVKTGSQQSTSSDYVYSTIERKTVGTKLKFVPQINEGDSVLLTIEQEVSSVAANTESNENGETFDLRTIKNSVLVKSGDTVVLGGLMDEKTTEIVSKVPILGDIPLIGELFKQTSSSKAKRNLMVFIKPIILRNDDDYSSLSSAKYTMFRTEQLERNKKGIRLLPITLSTPVLPALDATIVLSPGVVQVVNSNDTEYNMHEAAKESIEEL
jgi:general secretion pathway protein D